MNDKQIELIESQLAAFRPIGAPGKLRGEVLRDVHRELSAARWDRRLGRAAAVLLVVGVALNVALGMKTASEASGGLRNVAESGRRQSLVDTAVVVAEATDAATGRRFARQMAAMIGHDLTADEAAAIDAAVGRPASHAADGNKG